MVIKSLRTEEAAKKVNRTGLRNDDVNGVWEGRSTKLNRCESVMER
jgi:hypothetical protein